jgi:hypothetical protein
MFFNHKRETLLMGTFLQSLKHPVFDNPDASVREVEESVKQCWESLAETLYGKTFSSIFLRISESQINAILHTIIKFGNLPCFEGAEMI